jgi:uncharacterized protein YqeY
VSVHDELVSEQRAAMKAGDKPTVNVIRQVETEVAVAKAAPGFDPSTADDDLYRRVVASYVKKMDKARLEYLELGDPGRDQAAKLAFEVEYLSRWLSDEEFDEEAARVLVRETIDELGVTEPKQAGRVTGHVMRSTEGLDGAVVNRLVREELGEA